MSTVTTQAVPRLVPLIAGWVIFVSSGVLAGLEFLVSGIASFLLLPSYAFILATLFLRWKSAFLLIFHAPLIVAFIILCYFSYLWSGDPGTTLNEATRLLIHFLTAVCVVSWIGVKRGLDLTFSVLTIGCLLSILSALRPELSYGLYGDFRGMYQQKNILGFAASMAALYGAYGLIFGRPFIPSLIGLAAGLTVTLMTDSATSIVIFAVGCGTMLVQRSISGRKGMRLSKQVGLLVLLIFAGYIGNLLADTIISALGRDPTLTGRVALWDEGERLTALRPLFGYGYQILANDTGPMALYMIQRIGDFALQFHNSLLNIRFQLGIPGLVMNIAIIGYVFVISLREAYRGDPTKIVPLVTALGISLVLQSVSESTFGAPRSLQMFLLFLVLCIPGESRRSISPNGKPPRVSGDNKPMSGKREGEAV